MRGAGRTAVGQRRVAGPLQPPGRAKGYSSWMVEERRRDVRVRSPGGVVRCESARGEGFASRWLDLGTGGLFVEAAAPTPVGALLTLEFEIPGESGRSSAAGRVTWVREKGSEDG